MEVPRLEIEIELQLLAYAADRTISDLNQIGDIHNNSWQHWILNPLSEARDQIHNLMDYSQICYHCATMGSPFSSFLILIIDSLSFFFLDLFC